MIFIITDTDKMPIAITVNDEVYSYSIQKGYALIKRTWKKGDTVSLDLPMQPQRIFAHEKVKANTGRFAIQNGPIVYCLEGPDNKDSVVQNIIIKETAALQANYNAYLLHGINVITADGEAAKRQLNTSDLMLSQQKVTAIPYYAWNNRGPGEMEVWIPYTTTAARPQPAATIAHESTVTSSVSSRSLKAINDQLDPADSKDNTLPYFHCWPKNNTTEWVSYQFDQAYTVSSCKVYWYDDGPSGGCRIPVSWKIYFKKGSEWVPVKNTSEYEIAKDKYNSVSFETVKTSALKLEFQLPVDNSSGIHEWIVE
ncbi:MAG: glycoside hydrolase family 127 protein [Cyclobacteriaceae bacterium]|nr:glycoside hydrolase family 127 protein [Cyclobacteriaceae bacterium]